jgi:hypothetical protein
MSKLKSLKVNSVLSENSYFKVLSINKDNVTVIDTNGIKSNISNDYVEQILDSADYFTKEEKKTKTELADLLINNPRVAMTVAFYKQDTPKTAKAYKAEKDAKINQIINASLGNTQKLLEELVDNPILKYVPGALRVIKGFHRSSDVDELGRITFIDMELDGEIDSRKRLIDTRTIQSIIFNNVKYNLK